jgi:hypothetical protein
MKCQKKEERAYKISLKASFLILQNVNEIWLNKKFHFPSSHKELYKISPTVVTNEVFILTNKYKFYVF